VLAVFCVLSVNYWRPAGMVGYICVLVAD